MNYSKGVGHLSIIIGCMFSGKTSYLLNELNTLAVLGKKVAYINHSIDTRSDANFSTHSSLIQNTIPVESHKASTLDDLIQLKLDSYDAIGIDEFQFFDKSVVEHVKWLVYEQHKYVVIASLDADRHLKQFGHVFDLIPFADSVTKKHAYCFVCSKNTNNLVPAIHSMYLGNAASQIVIGGANSYVAVCRKCWIQTNLLKE